MGNTPNSSTKDAPSIWIGSLYFREDLSDGTVGTVSTTDERFIVGRIVTAFMFTGGRKPRLQRNLGSHPNDAEYMVVLADAETEDAKLLHRQRLGRMTILTRT